MSWHKMIGWVNKSRKKFAEFIIHLIIISLIKTE